MSNDQPKKKVSQDSQEPTPQVPQENNQPVVDQTPDPTPPAVDPPSAVDPPPADVSSGKAETAKGYEVPKGEEGLFHVEYEPRSGRFNQETGAKRHKPFVQKFNPRDYALTQISTNDAGEPIFASVGWRINKFLHIPDAKYLTGVVCNVVVDKKLVKRPIADQIAVIKGIIKLQNDQERK